MVAWASCVGDATWMSEALQGTLHYDKPLPVQQAIVPTVTRALLSGVPMDVSLTAPTGSGKTLCYALPMLRMVADAKLGAEDVRLRALILVPTRALGQQVHRELQRLTRHTTIAVVSLCGTEEKSAALVRRVRLPHYSCTSESGYSCTSDCMAQNALAGNRDWNGSSSINGIGGGSRVSDESMSVHAATEDEWCYFSLADILITTPQRLLRHLDHTTGLRLASLRLLVIDEADQVLANNFANFVAKVVDRFDAEMAAQQRRDGARMRSTAMSPLLCISHAAKAHVVQSTAMSASRMSELPVLHKMICSATLSSRIARISEVRLRNCRYYALDSNGQEVQHTRPTEAPGGDTGSTAANADTVDDQSSGRDDYVRRDVYALPPTLQEHILFVEDAHRHAVLLKLVRKLLDKLAARRMREQQALLLQRRREADEVDLANSSMEENACDANGKNSRRDTHSSSKNNNDDCRTKGNNDEGGGSVGVSRIDEYPQVEDNSGNRIMIFCNTAEEARVTGHFLSAAGVEDVVEFTTAVTEAERRRALLGRARVIVASDALMRGIDITDVGHVILYHAPQSVAQYVHRGGRTARAMRCGHLHLLLCKNGPTGELSDGEVAQFKLLSASVQRSLAVRIERGFFRFAQAPRTTAAAKHSNSVGRSIRDSVMNKSTAAAEYTPDDAEWWIAEANHVLERSQLHLQRMWLSAMDAKQVLYTSKTKSRLVDLKQRRSCPRVADWVDMGVSSSSIATEAAAREDAEHPVKKKAR